LSHKILQCFLCQSVIGTHSIFAVLIHFPLQYGLNVASQQGNEAETTDNDRAPQCTELPVKEELPSLKYLEIFLSNININIIIIIF